MVSDWFDGAGLGLFVHWDHASQQGIEISWPLVGRSIIPGHERPEDAVTVEQYHSTATSFDPHRWDADALARLARGCGARYIVFTARHHSGYSMFHSAHSDFGIAQSAYSGDITREFVNAVRAQGLRVGIYYSLPDWRHPDYPAFRDKDRPYQRENYPRPSAQEWRRYLKYVRGQLTELLTNYGQIDLLWFDGEWERTAEEWQAEDLRVVIKSLQPEIVINDRLPGQGDYATPEQALPNEPPDGPWEMCLTMSESWAYRPADVEYKTTRHLAEYLIEVASRGGNLLLNVGPRGDGSLPEIEVARLKELGGWLAIHGEAVLGVRPAPTSVRFPGPVTRRGNVFYLHLVMRPVERIVVRGLPVHRIREIRLLGKELPLEFRTNIEVHQDVKTGDEPVGEVIIPAFEPTSALVDILAVELLSTSEIGDRP
jgi:alpha-L-fucosidase